jgi:hypothetical protein
VIADAVRALSKLPPPVLSQLAGLPFEAIKALADWLDGNDDHPEPTEALEMLGVLKSEIALARMQERAAKQG